MADFEALPAGSRRAMELALEALEYAQQDRECPSTTRQAITALRAALAQQKDPTDPGNDVDVLREHVRHLERRVRQLHAQQAEPVERAMQDAVTTGMGIMRGGERIDPSTIYKPIEGVPV